VTVTVVVPLPVVRREVAVKAEAPEVVLTWMTELASVEAPPPVTTKPVAHVAVAVAVEFAVTVLEICTTTAVPAGPLAPDGPDGPDGPAGPIGPCGPAGPLAPDGPLGPWGPAAPDAP